jgi:glycosyltransferase involved in cell wall biosynthesis
MREQAGPASVGPAPVSTDAAFTGTVLFVMASGIRGGVGTVVRTLGLGLQQRGATVDVLCLSDGPLLDDMRRAGLRCEVRPVPSKLALGALARAGAAVRGRRYDVVHTHAPRAMFAINPAARLGGVPVVVTTIHGVAGVFDRELGRWRSRAHRALERLIARGCTDGLIVWSQALLEDVARQGFRRAMLHHIDNPVDTVRFAPPGTVRRDEARRRFGVRADDRVVGIVGRLADIKGQHILIDAFAGVRQEIPAARLLVAGAGETRAALEAQAARHGLASCVTFLGDVEEPDSVLHACDLAAYPSTHGIIGLAALEAMACGLPVIASSLPGVDEFVSDGKTARLVPPGDREALARAIVALLSDLEQASALGRAGRQAVIERFNPDRFVNQHASLYNGLLQRSQHRRHSRGRKPLAASPEEVKPH